METGIYKRGLMLLICIMISSFSFGQAKNSVYERYLDFNLARFENNPNALHLGEALLDSVSDLKPKVQTSFYNSLAKLYEDSNHPDKAISYYLKVAAAVPEYYVAQRALGYLYYDAANEVKKRLNASPGDQSLTAQYTSAVKKALPYLEKAQACDPSDDTLDIIKTLYQNIHDKPGLDGLKARLVQLSKNCLDILSEE